MGAFRCIQESARAVRHPTFSRLVGLATANVVLAAVLAGGCRPRGPSVNRAEGVVTLDGSSLPGATIVFRPVAGGPAAAGVTDASGRYAMTTLGFKPGAGVLAGDYVVSIRKYKTPEDELPPKPEDPGALAQWQTRARTIDAEWSASGGPPLLTPQPYANEATSGLSVTIVPGPNAFDFELESGFKGQPAR